MAVVHAEGLTFETNKLIIKHGRGNSVGLWHDSKTRFGYVKIPAGHDLVVLYTKATCRVVESSNVATIFGNIHIANVGNILNCEGNVARATVGNRAYTDNVKVKTVDEKILEHEEYMKRQESVIQSMMGNLSEAEKKFMGKLPVSKHRERKKTIINIEGKLDKLRLHGPSGIPTELLVYGEIYGANVGNVLDCKGDIKIASVKNCSHAHYYGYAEDGVYKNISTNNM